MRVQILRTISLANTVIYHVKSPGTDFEAAVTVADQVQQASASNLSANTYVFILIPAAA
jgi:hypothetical protein